jgi:hypothetical protein|tara:strand:+ start:329 stop:889 length:561 start_codon:yes stop_codon:yes gene_type:complete
MTINLRKESEDAVLELDIKLSKTISDSCNKLLDLQNQIKTKKEEVKKFEEEEKRLSQKVIPELMQQAGIKMLKLSDGAKVEVKDKFTARQSAGNKEYIFDWLRENGLDSIIKNKVSVSFARSQDNEASDVTEQLKQKFGDSVRKESYIEAASYTSTLREHVSEGKAVPMDKLGIYIFSETKINRKD